MNILIISPGYHTVTGNHGGAIENLINIYLEYNEDVKDNIIVYTVKTNVNEDDNNLYKYTNFRSIDKTSLRFKVEQKIVSLLYKLKILKCKKNYYRKVIKDLKKRNEVNKYDKIILENGLENIEFLKNKLKSSSKFVLHLHNDYLNVETPNAQKIVELFDEIWCVSDFVKNRVVEISNTPEKVKTISNCIDFEKFKVEINEESKIELRKKLNIKDKDFVFIYVGRIMAEKGTLELVKAFNSINSKYENTKLLVVGGSKGLEKESEYLNKVNFEAKDNKNIIFTGQLNNNELVNYYKLANIQVVPSIWNEAFGLIILEGVACNLPIIASSQGGIPEILEDKCLYVNVNSLIHDLIEKMKFSITNYERVKENTLKYDEILKKYSKENYNNRFKELLQK